MMKKVKPKTFIKKTGTLVLKIIFILFIVSVLQVLILKWTDPVTSSVMIQRQIESLFTGGESVSYIWCNYNDISVDVALAVIASEDQNFPNHFGFDFDQINKALKERKERELALWEMFISTHDSILAKLPFETKKSLAISIDPRIFQEERYNSYRSVSDVLENRYSKILMMFHEKFLSPYLETIEFTNL